MSVRITNMITKQAELLKDMADLLMEGERVHNALETVRELLEQSESDRKIAQATIVRLKAEASDKTGWEPVD